MEEVIGEVENRNITKSRDLPGKLKVKTNSKLRLRLSLEVKHKARSTENGGQSSIQSFFQRHSTDLQISKEEEELEIVDHDNVKNGLAENNGKSSKSKKRRSKKKSHKEEKRKVHFSEQLKEFSPEPRRKHDKEHDIVNDNYEITDDVQEVEGDDDLCNEVAEIITTSKMKNAFAFMMDNRNKIIGRNSPGKELVTSDEIPDTEYKEKKLARKVAFQEWSNTKGAKKRKLDDDDKGIIIENKLKKRAKRLKKLLTIQETNDEKITINIDEIQQSIENVKKNELDLKIVSEEALDSDMFIKRKKKNLILYSDSSNESITLKSEEKVDTHVVQSNSTPSLHQSNLSSFFGSLNSKFENSNKTKEKLRLSLKKNYDSSSVTNSDDFSNSSHSEKNNSVENGEMCLTPSGMKHWKMRLKVDLSVASDEQIKKLVEPKNCVDDQVTRKLKLSGSVAVHDACEIKGKKSKNKTKSNEGTEMRKIVKPLVDSSSDSESDNEPLSSKLYHRKRGETKQDKPIKLAPLFVLSKGKAKLDPEAIKARKKFLHSAIPDSLKKQIEKQHRVEEIEYEIFPSVSHITVRPTDEQLMQSNVNFWNLPAVHLNLLEQDSFVPKIDTFNLGSINSTEESKDETIQTLEKVSNIKDSLKQLKIENPEYPVYKTFKSLCRRHFKIVTDETVKLKSDNKARKKRKAKTIIEVGHGKIENQDIWTDLYKPSRSEEIFGNHVSVSRLKKWLIKWLEFSKEMNRRRNKRDGSDDSDSSLDFDGDIVGTHKLPGNTVIVHGPNGCGKTMTLYSLCNELCIDILEINASSKRTGKRLLQELQEATQSHQVGKSDTNILTFLNKESHQNIQPNSKKMCLLLIEDVDLVFEQDENFVAALSQLVATSKRPVVLTTTDANCLHLKKFFEQHSVVNFSAPSAKVLGTWLQIVALIEGARIKRETLVEIFESNKRDIRRTLLELQFWIQNNNSKFIERSPEEISKVYDDDSSNITWITDGGILSKERDLYLPSNKLLTTLPLDLGPIWWNIAIPNLINVKNRTVQNEESKTSIRDLEKALNIFESLATIDVCYKKCYVDCDLEPVHRRSFNCVKNSLELSESLENYRASKQFVYEWSGTLLNGYLNFYKPEESLRVNFESFDKKRWLIKQHKCEDALLGAVPLTSRLDHVSVHSDYLAMLRTMARSETVRANNNNKRRNRFYNYLRSVGVSDNGSVFETSVNVLKLTEN